MPHPDKGTLNDALCSFVCLSVCLSSSASVYLMPIPLIRKTNRFCSVQYEAEKSKVNITRSRRARSCKIANESVAVQTWWQCCSYKVYTVNSQL